MKQYEKYLESIYYDPAHPASYSGPDKLFRSVRKAGKYVLTKKRINDWLSKQETYTVHKGIKRKFRKQKIVVPYKDYMWEADTAYMTTYTKHNDGLAYFLLVIDVFSKFVWTFPMKYVRGEDVLASFQTIRDRKCEKLRTDVGSEFKSKVFQKWLKVKGIGHFYALNESKCAVAERAIKTIKSRISRYMTRHQTHRWIDVLENITTSYNNTFHRSIKRTPASVRKEHNAEIWNVIYNTTRRKRSSNQKTSKYKFKIGDTVRLTHQKRPFQREYDERWTIEYFVVSARRMKEGIPIYSVKDIDGDEVKGTFYSNELSKIIVDENTPFRIEKVIKRVGNNVMVKWLGWSNKFISLIPASDVISYQKSS